MARPTLSANTLKFLRALVVKHYGASSPTVSSELAEIDAALAGAGRFTLVSLPTGRWLIGAGDGIELAAPTGKRGISEVARGLALMEVCIAWPGDPVAVQSFLAPGRHFDDLTESASVLLSRTRQWVADHVDSSLAEHLKAVTVERHDMGPVAVYRPASFALPIATSFDP